MSWQTDRMKGKYDQDARFMVQLTAHGAVRKQHRGSKVEVLLKAAEWLEDASDDEPRGVKFGRSPREAAHGRR